MSDSLASDCEPRVSSAAPTVEYAPPLLNSSEEAEHTLPTLSPCHEDKEADLGDGETRSDGSYKQKRKRTSPEDQALLEKEYALNPKPNKAARAEIVKDVKLNEKEVQIWFQNRRQINRRKSRPLLPHEYEAFGLGGLSAFSSDPISIRSDCTQSTEDIPWNEGLQTSPAGARIPEVPTAPDRQTSAPEEEARPPGEARPREEAQPQQEEAPVEVLSVLPSASNVEATAICKKNPDSESSIFAENVSKSFTSTPGYLANRWNPVDTSLSIPAAAQLPDFMAPLPVPAPSFTTPDRPAQAEIPMPFVSASRVRLSMSLDGKAELISGDLSPPRAIARRPNSAGLIAPQARARTLQRSQSAVSYGYPPGKDYMYGSFNPKPFIPSLPTGRSRDARNWKICCDAEARDELTTQAENESQGSAVAAISLIRSTSSTALKPNLNKRNAPLDKHEGRAEGKKAKLSRAQSSVARLQSSNMPSLKLLQDPSTEKLIRSPSGDSDKENYAPQGESPNPRRHSAAPNALQEEQRRPLLQESHNIPAHAHDLDGRMRRKQLQEAEARENEQSSEGPGAEVENFMRGPISPSKKGDLDCIQGLLSLSQGNWR